MFYRYLCKSLKKNIPVLIIVMFCVFCWFIRLNLIIIQRTKQSMCDKISYNVSSPIDICWMRTGSYHISYQTQVNENSYYLFLFLLSLFWPILRRQKENGIPKLYFENSERFHTNYLKLIPNTPPPFLKLIY